MNLFSAFLQSSDGATAIEYGLIAALISIVIIEPTTNVGTNLSSRYARTATCVKNQGGTNCGGGR
ncbi:MAG: Flp family type IVb pilin [Pseudomonadota bacterium]